MLEHFSMWILYIEEMKKTISFNELLKYPVEGSIIAIQLLVFTYLIIYESQH